MDGTYDATTDSIENYNSYNSWEVSMDDYKFTTKPQDLTTTDVSITPAVQGGTILNLYGNYEIQVNDSIYTAPIYTGYGRTASFMISNISQENYYKFNVNGKNLGSDMYPQKRNHIQTLEFKNSSTPKVYKLRIGGEETDCFSKNVSNIQRLNFSLSQDTIFNIKIDGEKLVSTGGRSDIFFSQSTNDKKVISIDKTYNYGGNVYDDDEYIGQSYIAEGKYKFKTIDGYSLFNSIISGSASSTSNSGSYPVEIQGGAILEIISNEFQVTDIIIKEAGSGYG